MPYCFVVSEACNYKAHSQRVIVAETGSAELLSTNLNVKEARLEAFTSQKGCGLYWGIYVRDQNCEELLPIPKELNTWDYVI